MYKIGDKVVCVQQHGGVALRTQGVIKKILDTYSGPMYNVSWETGYITKAYGRRLARPDGVQTDEELAERFRLLRTEYLNIGLELLSRGYSISTEVNTSFTKHSLTRLVNAKVKIEKTITTTTSL